METVIKSEVFEIRNLVKLRTIMNDYHRYYNKFEKFVTEILNSADETD